jgi:tetratricopeptide (TPR) repeat protein
MVFLEFIHKRSAIHLLFLIGGCLALILNSSTTEVWAESATSASDVQQLIKRSQQTAPTEPEKALQIAEQAVEAAKSIGQKNLEVDALNNLALIHLRLNRLNSAQTVLREALEISEDTGYLRGSGIALNRLGSVVGKLGERLEAKACFERALAIHTNLGDWREISRTLTNLANLYRHWGDYPRAIELFLKAREGYKKVDYQEGVAWLNFSLGVLHKNLEDYDSALEAINAALKTYTGLAQQSGNSNGVAICYGQLGDIHNLTGNPDQGLEYHLRALRLREEAGIKPAIADGLSGVGRSHFFLGDFQQALGYFIQSQALRTETETKNGTVNNLKFMGEIYREMGRNDQAMEYFNQGLEVSREISDRDNESEILEMTADLYARQGRYEEAWDFLHQHRAAQDLVLNAKISKKIASLQLLHEIENQSIENERLQRENRIKDLQLGRSRTQSLLLIFLTVFLASGGIFAVYLHRKQLQIKTLQGLIPICSHCKSIRTDSGFYEQLETYLSAHSDAQFSHGICPDCYKKYYPDEQADSSGTADLK